MGRRGWRGQPPGDDTEARKRIIDSALRMLERHGPRRTTLSLVAADLGITRPTVYRYFATTEELLAAAADVALAGWTARIAELTAGLDDAAELLVEAVAHLVERLPEEALLAQLLDTDQGRSIGQAMVLPEAVARSRAMLEHTEIDWAAHGFAGAALDDLVEFLLRLIQSMVIAPPNPPRSAAELRAYLRRWIVPILS
ncbi:helix-turn-helix domain-containing protein [[Mycobacterium] wendilense]|uniref:Helix-turn-helix domain-containing protein n=1 Tax=[Mycobacterium] wendilense TaxID=3064284 RepID=A0ABM9MEL4_9MYCO|nr:helix-turn-helix domain-containing protein [Mycolicibacterium sp. MU0050]CAJ1583309.1 helix-turn-helix domain-containing protein [Mycolicibacterium sp. MU0050]